MKTALFNISKDEDHYIDEFCDYYIKLGFDDIWIYQNNWRANLKTDFNGRVHLVEFDGEAPQKPALNDFIQKHWNEYDWAAFFDTDEFLILKKHFNIKEFLKEYSEFPGIAVNMRIFGDSCLKKVIDENYSVIDRFTHSDSKLNTLVKLILNFNIGKNKFRFFNPHIANCQCIDPNKKKLTMNGNISNYNEDEIAELAHYRNKTYEECYKRKFKNTDVMYGYLDRVNDPNSGRLNLDVFNKEFAEANRNEIENTSVKDFYERLKMKNNS